MMGPQYLCCLYLATAGQQGPNLGSDEQEIVLLIYVIVEISQNKIIGMRQYLVKPTVADVNENVLSDQIQTNTFLTEELVKTAGQPLESAIFDFDRYIYTTLNVDPNTSCFRLVTDGQLPLRQCLHPETCSKNIELPKYYTVFHDIRKEVFKFIQTRDKNNVVNQQQVNNTKQQTLLATMNANNVANFVPPVNGGLIQTVNGGPGLVNGRISPVNDGLVVVNGTTSNTIQLPQSVEEMLEYLEMKADTDNEYYVKEAKDIVNIVQRLISSGHRFDSPETVNLVLEPGICSKDDEIDGNCVVRARGLPWQSSDQDIAKFFRGLNVAKGGVALCLSPQGRRNGEAVVRFCSQEHRDMALKRHKHHIGIRYIEVYRASGEDFLAVAGGSSNEAQTFLSKGANVIIRMRGLPYDCTSKQVLDFFASGEQPCQVLDGADGVLFVKKPDGRATGDAFVLFEHEADAPRALSKHRELIGSRYIELFRSTTAEVQQVLNRSMDPKTYEPQQPLIAQMPQMPLLPQHIITSGTRKDCIRLRGLPYEAQVEHILEFLGDHAKNIVYQGVHMVYNAQGQPSGEAFIQMDSEKSAYLSAHQKHHRYMVFGKKQRYIEVFQCSGEDMSMVLTGGIPAPVSPSKGATALLSPGIIPPQPSIPNIPAAAAATITPQPTVNINTTVAQISQNLVTPNPALSWENPALYAQQQAQMIAQQNMLLKQNQAAQLVALQAAAAHHQHQQQQQNEQLLLQIAQSAPHNPGVMRPALAPPHHLLPPPPQQPLLSPVGVGQHILNPHQHSHLSHPATLLPGQTPLFFIPAGGRLPAAFAAHASAAFPRVPFPPSAAFLPQHLPSHPASGLLSHPQFSQTAGLLPPHMYSPQTSVASPLTSQVGLKRSYGDAFVAQPNHSDANSIPLAKRPSYTSANIAGYTAVTTSANTYGQPQYY